MKSTPRTFTGSVALVLALALRAPGQSPPDQAALRGELQRMQQQVLEKQQSLEQRLVDLRVRLDLGLAIDATSYLAPSDADLAMAPEEGNKQLLDEQLRVTTLQNRFDELRRAEEHALHAGPGRRESEPAMRPVTMAEPPAAPAVETRPLPQSRTSAPQHAPPVDKPTSAPAAAVVLIRGSQSHSAVGRALFLAGEYAKAKQELLLLDKDAKPDLMDLFNLARCHEKLADYSAADSVLARIEALDTKEGTDGKMVPGNWALAARIARQQMNWQVTNGSWRPPRSVESIEWRRQ